MIRRFLLAGLGAAMLLPLAAQAATTTVEVTRFHLLAPPAPAITGASIAVEPADPATAPPALQFGALAATASAELARAGFAPVAAGQSGDYVARIALTGTTQMVQKRSPFSIGIGGGTGGRNGGVGGGVSFPLGSGSTRAVTTALMTLQIRRVSDASTVWEGRASAVVQSPDAMSAAPALLQALLKGFPGTSGQSAKVKVKSAP